MNDALVNKPPLRFVNTVKKTQGPNFKEVKVSEVLENKKYLTKKTEKCEETSEHSGKKSKK